ncbi:MAG: M23 family metallopeptidase [Bacteroidia bacterium]|nr:M23 family metallopeptidase [Bacteroidia bacterium]
MRVFFIVFMLGICGIKVQAQEKHTPTTFSWPFDFQLFLSGNFGELRSNHLHSGLDFKTSGVNKVVRALGDGYISKIRVTNGSGYVLEVSYRNGYRTINRHLNGFVGPIAERVKELQYEKESWEVEWVPQMDEYPVKAGDPIAWSGNMGYSMGPHLHLEVIEEATGDYVDPLSLFKKGSLMDTRPPRAEGIMLFPQMGYGVVEGAKQHPVIGLHRASSVKAWGLIGFGIKAYDYMNGTNNHYGVYSVALSVDGQEVFKSELDRFSASETRMINSWTYGGYMKSFIAPGNTLRFLQAYNAHRGLVEINEERPYHFCYTLKDYFGNSSQYRFIVQGLKQPIPAVDHGTKYAFGWNKINYLQEPGMTLVVPKGMLYEDVWLDCKVKADSGAVAFTYQLHDKPLALHAGCELKIGIRRKLVKDSLKYYVARVWPNGRKYSAGGVYENGFMKTLIRELGTYTVAIDTVPPVITPVSKSVWGRMGKIVYRLKDMETGIAAFRGTIDGQYAPFKCPNTTRPYWECDLDKRHFKKGGKHVVELTVTDRCGNQSVSRDRLIW